METELTRFPHIQGMHPNTAKLIELLREPSTQSPLPDSVMTAFCNGEETGVGGKAYPRLLSAIRHVKRYYKINWARSIGERAIVRLDGEQSIQYAEGRRSHIRRVATDSVRTLGNIEYEKLEPAKQATARAMFAQAGTLAAISREHTTKQLESRGATKAPDMAKLLDAWRK